MPCHVPMHPERLTDHAIHAVGIEGAGHGGVASVHDGQHLQQSAVMTMCLRVLQSTGLAHARRVLHAAPQGVAQIFVQETLQDPSRHSLDARDTHASLLWGHQVAQSLSWETSDSEVLLYASHGLQTGWRLHETLELLACSILHLAQAALAGPSEA